MSYVIQLVCFADGTEHILRGGYLRSWDVDAHDGRGTADWTPDPTRAHQFDSLVQAHHAWTETSTVTPRRSTDGKPNRPLTMFTVAMLSLDDALAGKGFASD